MKSAWTRWTRRLPPGAGAHSRLLVLRRWPRHWLPWLALPAWLALACALSVVMAPVPDFALLAAGSAGSDAVLLDRQGRPVQRLRLDWQRRQLPWVPLAQFSPALVQSVLAAEDHRFYHHAGVDAWALGTVAQEALGGHRLRGASTVTMQLASLLAREGRSRPSGAPPAGAPWLRKLRQMRDAWALERSWSKGQILEAYLNLVPLRGELAGFPAGAFGLLGKGPGDLDNAESALLASRACHLLRERSLGDDCDEAASVSAALPRTPLAIPGVDEAPHLARLLLHQPGQSLRCTLDLDLQRFVADALRNRLAELEGRNVADGAVLVLDNASGQVLAYVGSSGDFSSASQVDGVRAMRQPGSTLKPFLYGLALDRGWLEADSIVQDAPFTLATPAGLYAPQDYEHDYKGAVSVRTALASSLNMPAVRTLDLVGVDRFLATLHALGMNSLRRDARDYGVGLALGDGDTSLLELTNAYRALANGGRWTEASTVATGADPPASPRQVLTPATSFILGDILSDASARAPTFGLASPLAPGMWAAVKTGTSKGMRDNWALGYTDRYTVGVWVGNFSGAPMWDVSGVSGAAPLWRDIVVRLQSASPSRAPRPPAGVVQQHVRFVPAIEPPRQEWFKAGPHALTAGPDSARVVVLQSPASQPRLLTPPDQAILAPDPDIPQGHQKILVRAQGPRNACLEFDGHPLASCGELRLMLSLPAPVRHLLRLLDASGAELAQSSFQVRALFTHRSR